VPGHPVLGGCIKRQHAKYGKVEDQSFEFISELKILCIFGLEAGQKLQTLPFGSANPATKLVGLN
jgi:hypothetical protein